MYWRFAAFRGELTSHHPHFHPASPAAAKDIDIETAKQLLPQALTVGIHMGLSIYFFIRNVNAKKLFFRNLAQVCMIELVESVLRLIFSIYDLRPSLPYNAEMIHKDIEYTEEDDKAIDDWIAGMRF